MKRLLALTLLLATFALLGCTKGRLIEEEKVSVDLAWDELEALPLTARFESDSGIFAYAFEYNGQLIRLVDYGFEGASEPGPSFKIEGGAEITGKTVPAQEYEYLETSMEPLKYAGHPVYRFSDRIDRCDHEYAVLFFLEEALVLQSRACADQDAELGAVALDALLDGLSFTRL